MKEEIKLKAEIRHIRRLSNSITLPMVLISGILFFAAVEARHKTNHNYALGFVGGSMATLLGWRFCLTKFENKEKEIRKRLSQIQKERV